MGKCRRDYPGSRRPEAHALSHPQANTAVVNLPMDFPFLRASLSAHARRPMQQRAISHAVFDALLDLGLGRGRELVLF